MKTLTDRLSQYAAYHRDARNIATHLVGVPLIVLAIMVMLSRPVWVVDIFSMSPAVLITSATLLYYLRLDVRLGLIMTVLYGLGLWLGATVASWDDSLWLAAGVGGFLIGWVIQFIGHYFEGRKPAFFDDVVGLVIGPLFVTAEVLFKWGLFSDLKQEIECRSGPTH